MHLLVSRFCYVTQAGLELTMLAQSSKCCNYLISPEMYHCQSMPASLGSISDHIQVLTNHLGLGERP